ncbi:hypothetical protein [Corynebacterium glutamicum]|uniref:hypothetical protein n=1 Tax=Corynebacterium glutamicum TaxID=1718 RepID=UPI001B8D3748|nr:hypothetical protein [Corynebacterium glutamicum]
MSDKKPFNSYPDLTPIIHAARDWDTEYSDQFTATYLTEGGTYIIASRWRDECKDLVAILPGPLEGTRVLPLQISVNPDLIDALRKELDR